MASRKVVWSIRAKSDLISILEYFHVRNGSKTYSKKLNARISRSVRLLSKYPNLGLQTDVSDVRNLIDEDYAIFYQVSDEIVRIIAIWDCRQNSDSFSDQISTNRFNLKNLTKE